jgi:hypothetical protein
MNTMRIPLWIKNKISFLRLMEIIIRNTTTHMHIEILMTNNFKNLFMI